MTHRYRNTDTTTDHRHHVHRTDTETDTNINKDTHAHTHIHTHIYIYTYTYTYIHTYTNTHKLESTNVKDSPFVWAILMNNYGSSENGGVTQFFLHLDVRIIICASLLVGYCVVIISK